MENEHILHEDVTFYLTKDQMNNEIPIKIYRINARSKVDKQSIHSHEYIQMWYVVNGKCIHEIFGHSFEYHRFGLIIVPPYTPHSVNMISYDADLICCEFSERFINESLSRSDRETFFDYAYLKPFYLYKNIPNKIFKISNDKEMIVESLMIEILEFYENKKNNLLIFIKANLLKLLAIIALEFEHDFVDEKKRLINDYREAIDRAIRYLEENYSSKLYLEEVCKISHMSHSTFSYIFKQITEKTFSEYVINLRISKACELLKKTNLSILKVSIRCGFNDSTYFCRVFKKLIGVPPILYKKQSRISQEDYAGNK